MERKILFAPGEYYHVFSRGTEKRKVFQNESDYGRFQALLYILNQTKKFHVSDFLKRGKRGLIDIYNLNRADELVSILAYSLMPNHFHLLIHEKVDGGITKFMSKLLTSYSMYFNTKYERSGSLFVHPFRAVHIDNDTHLRHLFSYIHLNCLDLNSVEWKDRGIKNLESANRFLMGYKFSSYPDFLGITSRKESIILDHLKISNLLSRTPIDIREYELWYNEMSQG